ncbi:putative nucleotidyltransferase [Candidatus Methanoperedens nitroreducens]|uniref:Putative nucleotidyltransferase n=1 Tax=Candidatus Methanoperedens nitratireducens TaxID=1392998 RepID=A0A062UVG2_9EURY|nr:nucleotidyltransferase domain-containing protein [Candidatus Methanoperedens nitroreducens]KCZ71006.1 putative nucleotidyltransferase [Candidatus Methanoperedens nitroreducens]MDJ1421624.1 nucleotidyltransferase domain-containing protein [Candidatus Methanoperedens sp.]
MKDEIEEIVSRLKQFSFIHSIVLFGSKAKGTGRAESDVDICIVPKPEADVSLKERIALNNIVPESIDISLLSELPVYIRKRVFLEGKVLYTEDPYYVLTLAKENDLEYVRYQRMKRDYHTGVMKRVRLKLR